MGVGRDPDGYTYAKSNSLPNCGILIGYIGNVTGFGKRNKMMNGRMGEDT